MTRTHWWVVACALLAAGAAGPARAQDGDGCPAKCCEAEKVATCCCDSAKTPKCCCDKECSCGPKCCADGCCGAKCCCAKASKTCACAGPDAACCAKCCPAKAKAKAKKKKAAAKTPAPVVVVVPGLSPELMEWAAQMAYPYYSAEGMVPPPPAYAPPPVAAVPPPQVEEYRLPPMPAPACCPYAPPAPIAPSTSAAVPAPVSEPTVPNPPCPCIPMPPAACGSYATAERLPPPAVCAPVTTPCPTPAPAAPSAVLVGREVAASKAPPANGSEKSYVVELKLTEARPGEKEQVMCCPKVTLLEGASAVVQVATGQVGLAEGTIKDLVTRANYVSPDDQLLCGYTMRVKAVGLPKDYVRIDLSLKKSDVESASKDGILVLGQEVRLVRKVRLGKAVKVALDKDEQGTARTWIEFKVTQDKDERPIGPPISFSTGLFR